MPDKLAVITDPARLLEHKPIDTEWLKDPYGQAAERKVWLLTVVVPLIIALKYLKIGE